MNHIIGTVTATVLGAANQHMNTKDWLYNTIQFTVTADIAEGDGAQFEIQCAPPSDADYCVPGDFAAIPEVVICQRPAVPAERSVVALQGPLDAGQICKVALPCPCPGFMRVIVAADPVEEFPSGSEASVSVIGLVQGPKK